LLPLLLLLLLLAEWGAFVVLSTAVPAFYFLEML